MKRMGLFSKKIDKQIASYQQELIENITEDLKKFK